MIFADPKMNVLFEDIEAAGKLASDLKLYSLSSILYFLIAAIGHDRNVDVLRDMSAALNTVSSKYYPDA